MNERDSMGAAAPRILVIDDDPDTCVIVSHMLKFLGCEPVSATETTEALALVLHEKFSGALFDLVMPGLSGFDLLRALKASPYNSDIPVIAMSAHEEYRYTSLTDGFYLFLKKPVDIAVLKTVIEEMTQPPPPG